MHDALLGLRISAALVTACFAAIVALALRRLPRTEGR
jgi:hypothetical protein